MDGSLAHSLGLGSHSGTAANADRARLWAVHRTHRLGRLGSGGTGARFGRTRAGLGLGPGHGLGGIQLALHLREESEGIPRIRRSGNRR